MIEAIGRVWNHRADLAAPSAQPVHEPECEETRILAVPACWTPSAHGGGWWIAKDADGCDVILSSDVLQSAPNAPAEVDPPDVRCNKCGWLGYDDDLVASIDSEDGEPAQPCPTCGTDANLMDVLAPAEVEGLVERFDVCLHHPCGGTPYAVMVPSPDGGYPLYYAAPTAEACMREAGRAMDRMAAMRDKFEAAAGERG